MKKTILSLLLLSLSVTVFATEDDEEKQTHFSFLRDFAQPLGSPTVTAYYRIRENIFLNTRSRKQNPPEAIGNLLLAPTRYLFAGKTIRPDEVTQCYTYKSFHWLKTPLALATLPVSLVAGSIFKAVGYLGPKARKKHRAIKTQFSSPQVDSNLAFYKELGFPEFHCDAYTESQGFARPVNITKKHQKEVQALGAIAELLDKNEILHWIDCGTCLGAYRYGGFIPWDYDIDVSILTKDHDNVKRVLQQLDTDKYEVQDWSAYSHPGTFLKVFIKETKTQIDLYHYNIDAEKRTVANFFTYCDSPLPQSWIDAEMVFTKPLVYETVFPLKKAKFDGLEVWAPHDIEGFLKEKYGENLDPVMVWNESIKKYERVEDHPYWLTHNE